MVIDDNLSTVIHSNSSVFETKSASESVSANADQHDIGVELRLTVILGVCNVQFDTLGFIVYTGCGSCVHHKLNALLLQRLSENFSNFIVEEWANTISVLQYSNLGAESGIDATKFKSDNTATNDCHLVGNLFQIKCAS